MRGGGGEAWAGRFCVMAAAGKLTLKEKVSKLAHEASELVAKAKYKQAHEKVIELALARFEYGTELVQQGNKAAALDEFKQAAKFKPEAAGQAGVILADLGQPRDALDYLKEALAANAKQPDVWAALAKAYNEMGKHEEALKAASKGIAENADKTYHKLHHERVVAHVKLSQPAQAVSDVDRILEVTPWAQLPAEERELYAHVLLQHAAQLIAAGRFGEAAPYMRLVCEHDPSKANLSELARCLAGTGRDEDAVWALQQLVAKDPGNTAAWLQLGDALYHLGRFAEACEAYAHAIPATDAAAAPRCYFNYAVSLVNTRRNAEAAKVLERLVEATPKDVESMTLLAQMYLEERDWVKAKDMLELVAQLAGASADSSLLYNLGFARLHCDLPEPALAAFKEALHLDPNNKQAKAAVRELELSAKKLTKRLSGPREKQETAQEMLDRIKAMLTVERPAYLLKRKSMETIRAGYVVAMKGGFDDIAKKQIAKRTHAA